MTMSWFSPLHPPLRTEARGEAWKSVLVPLDGSELSAWAVDRARSLLERPGISVTLLRVVECAKDRSNDLGFQMDSRHREARADLSKVLRGLGSGAASVTADIRFGDPATEILREVAEDCHDVVLMSGYGRAGLGRSLLGSVARRVLRSSPVPVLLFRPRLGPDAELARPTEARFERLLVALDGSRAAEEILPAAERMARTLGAEMHLFRAVAAGPGEGAERRLAEDDLGLRASGLASRGIAARVDIRTGDPAEAAFAVIRECRIDAVALATRFRTGLAHAVYGSVTRELIRGADVPILALCAGDRRLPLPASADEHRCVRVERP